MATTDFSKKCEILAQFYVNYKESSEMKDFLEYNDIGLPMAFLASEGLSVPTEQGENFINETWLLFLSALEVEDGSYNSLDEIFDIVVDRQEDE